MKFFKYLTFPISILFLLITEVRNWFFRIGLLKSTKFKIPVIVIGNLSTGGTGKTPMTALLVRYFSTRKNLAVLSRGYGRNTKGFFEVKTSSRPVEVGDEPLMNKLLYPEIPFFVNESRVKGIEKIQHLLPETNLFLLDDAFQHRSLKPGFSIVLTTFSNPFYTDFLLPTGSLRESRKSVNRANVIVVTKCPADLNMEHKARIKENILNYASCPVFFAHYIYLKPIPFLNDISCPEDVENVLLVTGIANNEEIKINLSSQYKHIELLSYPDHHHYNMADFTRIAEKFNSFAAHKKIVLTTHKDAVKWLESKDESKKILQGIPIFFQPIQMQLDEPEKFIALIENYVGKN